jgi:Protein of unknown function (DUF3987)
VQCSQATPVRRRLIVNDTTVEKLGELLNQNPNGVLIFRDELTGFLRTLDCESHETDRAFYLEAWNGTRRFVHDRIGRGTIDIQVHECRCGRFASAGWECGDQCGGRVVAVSGWDELCV